MNKIFVIAFSRAEADHWIKDNLDKRLQAGETTLSMSDYVYVDDVIKLRGRSDPHGVFVGRWKERLDLEEIVDTLVYSHTKVNGKTLSRGLEYVRGELQKLKRVRPTPKKIPLLVHVNGVMQMENTDYTIVGDDIVFKSTPALDCEINIKQNAIIHQYIADGYRNNFCYAPNEQYFIKAAAQTIADHIDQQAMRVL